MGVSNCLPILCTFLFVLCVRCSVLHQTADYQLSICLTAEEISERTDALINRVEESHMFYHEFASCVQTEEVKTFQRTFSGHESCVNPEKLGEAIMSNCMYLVESSSDVHEKVRDVERDLIEASRVRGREDSRNKNAVVGRDDNLAWTTRHRNVFENVEHDSARYSARQQSPLTSGGSSKDDLPSNDVDLNEKVTVRSFCEVGSNSCEFICCMLESSYGVSRATCRRETGC